jgi:hypothetical protein
METIEADDPEWMGPEDVARLATQEARRSRSCYFTVEGGSGSGIQCVSLPELYNWSAVVLSRQQHCFRSNQASHILLPSQTRMSVSMTRGADSIGCHVGNSLNALSMVIEC